MKEVTQTQHRLAPMVNINYVKEKRPNKTNEPILIRDRELEPDPTHNTTKAAKTKTQMTEMAEYSHRKTLGTSVHVVS